MDGCSSRNVATPATGAGPSPHRPTSTLGECSVADVADVADAAHVAYFADAADAMDAAGFVADVPYVANSTNAIVDASESKW